MEIFNGDWVEPLKNNTRHIGEGIGTALYTFELLLEIKGLVDPFLENKYNCFKEQLENESARKPEANGPTGTTAASPGATVGPGIIGNNVTGKDPGYAGASNLYVGEADPDALALAEAINALKAQRQKEIVEEITDACD